MRNITEESLQAFVEGRAFSKQNMSVVVERAIVYMSLHGHRIAERYRKGGNVFITNAGWPTATTKDRLNAVLSYYGHPQIYQRDWTWYWKDGEVFEIDTWYEVEVKR